MTVSQSSLLIQMLPYLLVPSNYETTLVPNWGKRQDEIHSHSFHSREAWYTPLQIIASYPCLSGCDSTGAFAKKGKTKMWNIIEENPEKYKEIATIGKFIAIRQPAVANAEVLVMEFYKIEPLTSNLLRYHLFCRKQGSGESLPPTYSAFPSPSSCQLSKLHQEAFVDKQATYTSAN